MGQEHIPDNEIERSLTTLGIVSLCQWDLLVFLYRHQTSLVSADYLARLLGYTTEAVVSAMDDLAALGLVGRSRVSQGARFYQFTVPSDSPRGEVFVQLLTLVSQRAGRLRLATQLRRSDQTSAQWPHQAGHDRAETRLMERVIRLRPHSEKRKGAWRKAI